jgi:glycosyltransferase involved in cell wall biosynthesis
VSAAARVLFVSKPVVPPWHDGSKNLVRDVARHLTRARPTVLTTPGAPALGPRVAMDPVYASPGRFAPGLVANARVLARLALGDAQDVWHFVFAPNAASSAAARIARTTRQAAGWRGKIVQTVASAPRQFQGADRLLFGDVVVALSEWTRAKLVGAGANASTLRVIPPCAEAPAVPSTESMRATRERYGLGHAKVVLYPGDYEVSRGAATFAEAIVPLAKEMPAALFVFACRAKTPRAGEAAAAIEARIREANVSARVRHVGEIDDLHTLIATSSVVAFPVDDLYGKVDVPLVLLEALALGVPLVLARGGPLETLTSARFVDAGDATALAREVASLLTHDEDARVHGDRGKELYATHFTPQVVAAQYDDLYEEMLHETP